MLSVKQQIAIKREAVAGTQEALAAADVIRHSGRATWEWDPPMTMRDATSATMTKRGAVMGMRLGRLKWKQWWVGTVGAPVDPTNLAEIHKPLAGCGLLGVVSGGGGSEICTWNPNTTHMTDETTGPYCTLGLYEDGKRFLLVGAVGNAVLNLQNGLPPWIDFEFTGRVPGTPADIALLAPTYPNIAPPPFLSAALTVDGYATPRISKMTLDLGNEIMVREDPNQATGIFTAQIVDRNPKGTLDPEEVTAATKNYWSMWLNNSLIAITTGAFPSSGTQYNKFTLSMNAQVTKIALEERNKLSMAAIEFMTRGSTESSADDDLTLIQS